jgi:predicted HicB family RNase H-like nuclease
VPKKPNARVKRIMVRLTPELHDKIARLAAAEHRSIANWAAYALEEAVARSERKSKPKQ